MERLFNDAFDLVFFPVVYTFAERAERVFNAVFDRAFAVVVARLSIELNRFGDRVGERLVVPVLERVGDRGFNRVLNRVFVSALHRQIDRFFRFVHRRGGRGRRRAFSGRAAVVLFEGRLHNGEDRVGRGVQFIRVAFDVAHRAEVRAFDRVFDHIFVPVGYPFARKAERLLDSVFDRAARVVVPGRGVVFERFANRVLQRGVVSVLERVGDRRFDRVFKRVFDAEPVRLIDRRFKTRVDFPFRGSGRAERDGRGRLFGRDAVVLVERLPNRPFDRFRGPFRGVRVLRGAAERFVVRAFNRGLDLVFGRVVDRLAGRAQRLFDSVFKFVFRVVVAARKVVFDRLGYRRFERRVVGVGQRLSDRRFHFVFKRVVVRDGRVRAANGER